MYCPRNNSRNHFWTGPRNDPRRLAVLLGLVVQVMLCVGLSAQSLDLRVERGVAPDGVHDYEFSWVYWWESHGQAYLREVIGGRELPYRSPVTRRSRDDAVQALLPLLEDAEPGVREQAVVALSRIGYGPLEDRLIGAEGEKRAEDSRDSAWLIDDPAQRVRVAAWVALGLLETPRTADYLAQPAALAEPEQTARVAAIGLLRELSNGHIAALSALLTDPQTSNEVKRWVVWAVGRHDGQLPPDRRDAIYRWATDRIASPFVLAQVLSQPAYARRNGGAVGLIPVIRYDPAVHQWPGYRAVRAMPEGTSHGSTAIRVAMETRLAASVTLATLQPPEREADRVELRDVLARRAMAGNRAGVLDFNRGVDTIAFALLCDATPDDQALLYDLLRGFTLIPPPESPQDSPPDSPSEPIPASPPASSPELKAANRAEAGRVRRQSASPVRSYAALAVGLLIRRETEGTALHAAWSRPHLRGIERDRLKRRFGERLRRAIANPREPIEYRAACALALGLTGDPRYIDTLSQELERLRAGDEAVLGYGLLALAMLDESRVAGPARRYIMRRGEIRGPDDLIGRRAALQALAIVGEVGGVDTRDTLEGVWARDPWLSIEAGRVTQWTGLYDAVPAMLISTRSASARWRVAAALALGAALDREFPPRIEALASGAHYSTSFRRRPSPPPPDFPSGSPGGLPGFDEVSPPAALDPDPAEEAAPSLPEHYPAAWPIRELPAMGNPFLYDRLLGRSP